jgi:hypothetical protein
VGGKTAVRRGTRVHRLGRRWSVELDGPMSGGQHAKEEDVIDEVAHEEDEYINRVMQRKKKPRGNNGVPFVTPNLLIKLVRYCDHSTLLHNMQLTKMTIPLLQILLYILPLIVDDAVDTDFSVMHVTQSVLT